MEARVGIVIREDEQGGAQMSMVITIPDGLERLAESLQKLVTEVSDNIKTFKFGKTPDYREVESTIAERAAEIETNRHP
jgi:hypothetical protein